MVLEANFKDFSSYLQQLDTERVIPPLEKWNPEFCGEMDLLIKANGEWWHEGQLIRRQKMIDLFSKVLWKEQDEYYLKTPVEKIKIKVEDVPLLIVDVNKIEVNHQTYLQMTTQNNDVFFLDQQHPVFMRKYQGENRPYVRVRYNLDALVQRQAFYHLIEFGELYDEPNGTCLKLQSGATKFTISVD